MAAKKSPDQPLAPIEAAAKAYADAQTKLAEQVAAVEAEVAVVYQRHARDIHVLATAEALAKLALVKTVDANRSLFTKPKSRVLYGVKMGLRKGQDALHLGDTDALIRRIRDLMPDKVQQLIKTDEAVVHAGIKTLPEADLQRLGVRYVTGADEPFATVEKSDAAKAAAAILDSIKG